MSRNVLAKSAGPALHTGRFLYAVIAADHEIDLGPIGIDGGLVYAIRDGQIAAVVSDLPNDKLRPERRRIAAHHEVLRRLMDSRTILPMAFGLVADGPDAIHRILNANQAALVEQLQQLEGKVEMGLRVCWDVPNIFEYFVNSRDDLQLLRDHIFLGGREPTQEEKIALGRAFEHALREERASHTEKVSGVLASMGCEVKENVPRNEREIMNLACLIARDRQKDFEQSVFAAAKFFDQHYAFDFNGPWPPHNFVEIVIEAS